MIKEGMKVLKLLITDDLDRRVRVAAAQQGLDRSKFARLALESPDAVRRNRLAAERRLTEAMLAVRARKERGKPPAAFSRLKLVAIATAVLLPQCNCS